MSKPEPFQVEMGNSPLLPNSFSIKKIPYLKIIIIVIAQIAIIGITVAITLAVSSPSSSQLTPENPDKPKEKEGGEEVTPSGSNTHSFTYVETEGALANPLKGYFSWTSSRSLPVPVSMENVQVNMIYICETEDTIDLSYLEDILVGVAKRNRTAIVRFAVDDLGNQASPDWFLKKAQTNSYSRDGNTYKMVNFNDEYVLTTIDKILTALGKKFDGDPRIAFWQLGTYGHWGEWHETYVDKSKRASEESKDRMMDMNLNNFKKTMCQVRRPEERSKKRGIGFFHDALGDDGHDADMDGFFEETDTWDRWKTYCFGGDIAVPLQTTVFGEESKLKKFEETLKKYHPTYLMDSHFYKEYDNLVNKYPDYMKERNRIERMIGYNYFAKSSTVSLSQNINDNSKIDAKINLSIKNKGLAPFYYDWLVNFALVEIKNGKVIKVIKEEISNVSIKGIQPDATKEWSFIMKNLDGSLKNYSFALRIPSEVHTFVRLANEKQLEDADGGWFIIAENLEFIK